MSDARLKIAVFIDFDNIEIGVRSTLGSQFDAGAVLEALKERGEVVSKTAYADWKRADEYSRSLSQHAIKMVQRNLTPGGDKNGADINLALDALEMAFTHDHINAFVIVGGDSDFISLVEKLKQYDKKVFVVGGRAFTSVILQRNCHEFIAYENLVGTQASRRPAERGRAVPQAPVAQVFPLVRRALKVLSDREVSPQLGLLKSTLLQLDSTFSERSYGASTFRDFAEKLSDAGLVNLKHAGRNLQVELKDADSQPSPSVGTLAGAPAPEVHREPELAHSPAPRTESVPRTVSEESRPAVDARAAADPAQQAEGVRLVLRAFLNASAPPRWPMYVRNVKQFLRAGDPTFDERRFGFGSIVDLLRACQRDGVFRLERDRQGVLRVFQGSVLQQSPPAADRSPGEAAPRGPDVSVVEQRAEASGEMALDLAADDGMTTFDAALSEAPIEPGTHGDPASGASESIPGAPVEPKPARRRRTAAPARRAVTRTSRTARSRVRKD